MAKRPPELALPYIAIEGQPLKSGDEWTFVVSLVPLHGERRVLWFGPSYDDAILEAEQEARKGHGPIQPPLAVHDRVVHVR